MPHRDPHDARIIKHHEWHQGVVEIRESNAELLAYVRDYVGMSTRTKEDQRHLTRRPNPTVAMIFSQMWPLGRSV